jgi:hypothetical protein
MVATLLPLAALYLCNLLRMPGSCIVFGAHRSGRREAYTYLKEFVLEKLGGPRLAARSCAEAIKIGLRVTRGARPSPGVVPGVPAGQKRQWPRTQVEGGLTGSYHYHRNNHSPHLTRPLPKAVRRGRRTITPEDGCAPRSRSRVALSVTVICKPQQICHCQRSFRKFLWRIALVRPRLRILNRSWASETRVSLDGAPLVPFAFMRSLIIPSQSSHGPERH